MPEGAEPIHSISTILPQVAADFIIQGAAISRPPLTGWVSCGRILSAPTKMLEESSYFTTKTESGHPGSVFVVCVFVKEREMGEIMSNRFGQCYLTKEIRRNRDGSVNNL